MLLLKELSIICVLALLWNQSQCKAIKSQVLEHQHLETTQNHDLQSSTDPAQQKTIDHLSLQYKQFCVAHVYVPHISTASDISTQSIFNVFTEEEQANIIQLLFDQDYTKIRQYYLGKFMNSVLLWLSFFAITIICWVLCCVEILFVRRDNKGVSKRIKIVLTVLLGTIAFLTLYLSTGGIASDSEDQRDLMKKADCDFLGGSLTIINNQKQDTSWAGLSNLNAQLTTLQTFVSSLSTNTQTATTLQTNFNTIKTSLNTFTAEETKTLPNPNPLVTTALHSQFLQSLSAAKTSITADISAVPTHITQLNKISAGLTQLNTPTLATSLTQLQQKVNKALTLMVGLTNSMHSVLATQGSKVQDSFFGGLEYFFYFNLLTLMTGLLGFFGLSLTKNQHFGKCLHFTWFFGTCNLILGIICAIVFFYAGVLAQDGFCNPTNVILGNQQKAQIQFKNIFDAQPLLKKTLDQCVYAQNGNLANIMLQPQLSGISSVQSSITSYLTVVPIPTTNVDTLKTNCLAISGSYDLAISTTSNVADDSANTLTQWSNSVGTTSLQTNPTRGGGATCHKSIDQYVWKASSCGTTTQYQTGQPSSQSFGQPLCIVLGTQLTSNFATQRYTAALFTGCRALSASQPPQVTSVDAAIIKYYNALYAYVRATGAIFTPLCTTITTIDADVISLSTTLINLKPLVLSVQTDCIAQIAALQSQLSCSWLSGVLQQERSVICSVVFNSIADNYFSYAKSCYVLAIYLVIIAYITIQLFSRPLLFNVQTYDKNLNLTGTSQLQSQIRSQEGSNFKVY